MDMTTPNEFLCRLEDIPDGGVLGVDPPDPEGEPLVLARRGNSVQAWLNVCPHAGRRRDWAPGKFLLSKEGMLVCAAHGASFDLASGDCVAGPCRGERLREVPVHCVDGDVRLGPVPAQ